MLNQKFQKIDTVIKELKAKDENIYRTIFEAEPDNSKETRIADYNYLLNLSNTKIIDSTLLHVNEMLDFISLQTAEYNNLMRNASAKDDVLTCIPAIQPVSNKDLTRVASGYGIRLHPTYKIKKFHEGMDFTAPVGTEVYATGDGIVEDLDGTRRGSGNTITINHGFNYKTKYSHLDGFKVKEGQKVKRGDVIGYVGNTGFSVAPHLHYEVYLKGVTVNPVNYFFLDLNPEMYFRLIQLSLKSGQSFD
jgi:murein DD-endopeptidase MepM/ murein hydrolase activator NlpD